MGILGAKSPHLAFEHNPTRFNHQYTCYNEISIKE